MGGAISSFLGAVPLAFSASALFFTIFVAFLGMVLLGSAHGLILLPVLLSIFGPQEDQKGTTSKVGGGGEKTTTSSSFAKDVTKEPTKIPMDISEEEKEEEEGNPAFDTIPLSSFTNTLVNNAATSMGKKDSSDDSSYDV